MTPCDHARESNRFLYSARDYVSGDDFTIQQCGSCGLAMTKPIPLSDAMGRYYPEEYYGNPAQRRFPGLVEIIQGRLYFYRAWRIGRTVKSSSRRVLDIGCGKGFLLEAFRHQGWTVQGVELSDHSARHAREILGMDVYVGALPDRAMADKRFDAAVLWHVLEHVPDPARLLGEVYDLLNLGGLFLVSVPDFGCPEARLTRSGWFHLDVPRHLVHFTHGTLSTLLKETGFEIVERWRFAPEFDCFSFVQSALNWIGLPPNHLYRLLRGQGAKLPSRRDRWWHVPITLGIALPLALVGLVWVPVMGWLGFGSTLSYLARKSENRKIECS